MKYIKRHIFIFATILAVSKTDPGNAFTPIEFKDCNDCPLMVTLPIGEFIMGAPQSITLAEGVPLKRGRREQPAHRVQIERAIAIGKYEVTRRQFREFVNETKYNKKGGCKYWTGEMFETAASKSWRNPGYQQDEDHPAVCISWNDTNAYLLWLSKKTKKPYRLPSEAEWEYAARSGMKTRRFWGDSPSKACRYANVFDWKGGALYNFKKMKPHKCSDGYIHTSPVGSFIANSFGLHDTLGNAWEWTEDCWHSTYQGAPSDGTAWVTNGNCKQRVVRGGSWISVARFVRSSNRSKIKTDIRIYRNGFRVAYTLPHQ